jgi:raffinose synthase
MAQKMGKYAKEIPIETQFLLLESKVGSLPRKGIDCGSRGQMSYTVFLPPTEGPFRASLQGNEKDELELCFESGDPAITSYSFTHYLFITIGTDPFKLIKDAIRAMDLHLQTFCHRDEKKMLEIVDCFRWFTWDAFYTDVSIEGVEDFLSKTCL